MNVNCLLAQTGGALASHLVTVVVIGPGVPGVPLITPLELMANPAGRVAVHENGAVPPAPVTVAEYALVATPSGSDVVVIATMFSVRSLLTET